MMVFLPVVIGGRLSGAALSLLLKKPGARALAVVTVALIGSLLSTYVLHGWFGVLGGGYWQNAAVIAMAIAAIGLSITGLYSLLGAGGLGLAVVLIILVGNPLAGQVVPPEFVVGGWGMVGQLFPNGAANTLLRTQSYFPDAATGMQWAVLGTWAPGRGATGDYRGAGAQGEEPTGRARGRPSRAQGDR